MTLVDFVVSRSIKTITRTLCRVEKDWIGQVPLQGPLIIVANHINFLDVPLMYSHLYPRPMTGFAKIETWDNPLLGMLFNLMGAIPIQRGEANRTAITRGLQALQEGKILVISPEGTRSNDGRLNRPSRCIADGIEIYGSDPSARVFWQRAVETKHAPAAANGFFGPGWQTFQSGYW